MGQSIFQSELGAVVQIGLGYSFMITVNLI